MPEGLRELLEFSATSGNRSLHSEIVARLTRSFDAAGDSTQLQLEVEHLRELMDANQRSARLEKLMAKLLAESVNGVLRGLPTEYLERADVRLAGKMAKALNENDPQSLIDAFKIAFQTYPEELAKIEAVFEELEPVVELSEARKGTQSSDPVEAKVKGLEIPVTVRGKKGKAVFRYDDAGELSSTDFVPAATEHKKS